MAYARFGENGSDVYVIRTVMGVLNCMSCSLAGIAGTTFTSTHEESMIRHLETHAVMGDGVPKQAIVRLQKDIARERLR